MIVMLAGAVGVGVVCVCVVSKKVGLENKVVLDFDTFFMLLEFLLLSKQGNFKML